MSKRSNACDISLKVKQEVYIRDNQRCIICNQIVPLSCANSHYIKRSQGGLGIPKNITTMCFDCHYEYDHGKNSKEYKQKIKEYLQSKYKDWNEKDLYYNKWS